MITVQTSFLGEPPARAGEYAVPPDARVETCRSCGAEIIWARTAAERAIPLSVATVVWRGDTRYALSHFADCPDSRAWRRA